MMNHVIYDGFFILHLMRYIPLHLGHVSNVNVNQGHVLEDVVLQSTNAHKIISSLTSISIFHHLSNVGENLLRDSEDHVFYINDPEQRAPTHFYGELKNIKYKKLY